MAPNPYAQAQENKGKPLFVPFVVIGDPDKAKSVEIIKTLTQSGADALELGLPFSDPPADGPVIQAADVRALKSGIRMDDCFAILKEVRSLTAIPVGLLVYYNLVLQRGIEKFYKDCAECGVSSVLIADLPLEHSEEVLAIAKANGILQVFLISEVTTDERIKKITEVAEGYLYVVSYLGVTGVANAVLQDKMKETMDRARKYTKLPLVVGFGINTPEQITAAVRAGADGVIVGSRIVKQAFDDITKLPSLCADLAAAVLH